MPASTPTLSLTTPGRGVPLPCGHHHADLFETAKDRLTKPAPRIADAAAIPPDAAKPRRLWPAVTPSIGQMMNAAHAGYCLRGAPADLRPFIVGGQPCRAAAWSGMVAEAWITPQRQIIVAYQGTGGADNAVLHPITAAAQVLIDLRFMAAVYVPALQALLAGLRKHSMFNLLLCAAVLQKAAQGLDALRPAAALDDSVAFARTVQREAERMGIGAEHVFLTGHSLGGILAEYAAQQTGLGGISFAATGLPAITPHRDGANFLNIVTYGDPVANFCSDIPAMQPPAPAFIPGQPGAMPHHGVVIMTGKPANQDQLKAASANLRYGVKGALRSAMQFSRCFLIHHMVKVQAHDLGVKLTQFSVAGQIAHGAATLLKLRSDMSAPAVPAACDSLPEFQSRMRRAAVVPAGNDLEKG